MEGVEEGRGGKELADDADDNNVVVNDNDAFGWSGEGGT